MLTLKEALVIVKKEFPDGKIQSSVDYKNLYLFMIFSDDPYEGQLDPFYSVNKKTGEFRDFSVFRDGNFSEIMTLFQNAKKEGSNHANR